MDQEGEIVGLAVAFLLAWYHSREIRDTAAKLDVVQQSLSTHSLGPFPGFVDKIAETVRSAESSLVVACDFPSYGQFDGHGLAIRQAIEDRIGHIGKVELTFLDPQRREVARKLQFPEERWTESMKGDARARAAVVKFLEEGRVDTSNLTYPLFMKALRDREETTLQLFARADIKQINDDMPLFCWIADDKRAVIVVQDRDGTENSAFWTTDEHLIAALKGVIRRYREFAQPSSGVAPNTTR